MKSHHQILVIRARAADAGVDISATQVEMARTNVPTATFLQQDMLRLDFAADSFDGVAAFYTLTHLPYGELPGFLRNMGGWVRAGGLLVRWWCRIKANILVHARVEGLGQSE